MASVASRAVAGGVGAPCGRSRDGEAGPCGHRRTQWRIGRQDAMIPMAVAPRGRDEDPPPIQPLQRGEAEGGLPIRPGFRRS